MGRFFDIVLAREDAQPGGREARLRRFLDQSSNHTGTESFTARIEAEFATLTSPSDTLLACLARALETVEDDTGLQIWRAICERFPDNAYAALCHGDALLAAGQELRALDELLRAFESSPQLVDDFDDVSEIASRAPSDRWLRYQMAVIRSSLYAAKSAAGDPDDDEALARAADIREQYSELLEQYCEDELALSDLRALGEEISELEQRGVLPSTLIRRGNWRR